SSKPMLSGCSSLGSPYFSKNPEFPSAAAPAVGEQQKSSSAALCLQKLGTLFISCEQPFASFFVNNNSSYGPVERQAGYWFSGR
ncbi:hypothetical protein ANCDUO_26062, partial [Ancylostoma duodenale]